MAAMLHDHARIHLKAGTGGNGSASFRREAHVPRGGPDGGDGGRGGDVVLVCDDSLRDLQSFRRRAIYRAGQGGYGEGSQRHGADGERLTIRVPPGTEAIGCAGPEGEEGDLEGRRWELLRDGQRAVVAGEVIEARPSGHQVIALVSDTRGCRSGPRVARIVASEDARIARGEGVRVYGTVTGAVTTPNGKTVPEVVADFVVPGKR